MIEKQGRGNEARIHGRVPKSRRPLAALILGIVAVLVIAGGLTANWAFDTPVRWWALISIVGLALLALSIYLWIRLAD